MVGDVNLFLKGTPPHLRTNLNVPRNAAEQEEEEEEFEAELEIMIAGQLCRLTCAYIATNILHQNRHTADKV